MIKIALGDLRHSTGGKHSVFMPLGIGFIASYALSQLGSKNVEIRLYDDPGVIIKDIKSWKPTIVGLSNYCWNSELSRLVFRHAKKVNPGVVCVAGGPDFPTDHAECEAYLLKRPEIDFYVYFEGEFSFAALVKKIHRGDKIHQLKGAPQDGAMSIHPETGNLVFGEPLPRLMNMDEIPSPYLTGLMDQWFNGCYAPMIETARGCPFTCGYCFIGQSWFCPVGTFSVQRMKDELTYIAQRMRKYPDVLLSICDSNFGMYERDEEIGKHIGKLQDEFGWPNSFDVTTGKANYDRILRMAAILKNKMYVICSVQSLNPKTLEVIKRRNPSMDEYQRINAEIKKRGMVSSTEAIVPLPEETRESFFKGLRMVSNIIGVDRVIPYTTMLLRGTCLASKEYREKYQMQTKYRLLPRQFGEYLGEKCFEVEEVCVATKTMPFNDYLEVRGFSLVSNFFSTEQFDIIHRHLKELGVSKYDFIYHLWELIKSGKTPLSDIYSRYIEETKEELRDSEESIRDYFKEQENYNKLVSGEMGDNLIRKYTTKLLLEKCVPSIDLAYATIERMANKTITKDARESLAAARRWAVASRNISAVLRDDSYIKISENLKLPYDVNAWYREGYNSNPLITHNKPTVYRFYCDVENLKKIFIEIKNLYGGDFYFQIGKLLTTSSIEEFWRQCEVLK